MKPPFSYYGGKQRMASKIIPLIPQHTVYVEPFCGGATILFAKGSVFTGNNDHYREVINDTNQDVINFFEVCRDRGEELQHLLDYSLYSQEEHRRAKAYNGDDKLWKAYYFFVNINQSFANKIHGGWGTSVCGCNYAKAYKNKINITQVIDRLKSCYITSEDALACIKRWDSPQTFFYCDPPYPNTDQGHYSGYSQQDFENLIETLKSCQGSFILSCYHNDAVPQDWERFEFDASCSASNTNAGGHRQKRTEVVWRRFNTVEPRPEIIEIYKKKPFQRFCKKTNEQRDFFETQDIEKKNLTLKNLTLKTVI